MSLPRLPIHPPSQQTLPNWARAVVGIVNGLVSWRETLDVEAVRKDGADIYVAPTISDPPTAAEVQAIADALAVVSDRLK